MVATAQQPKGVVASAQEQCPATPPALTRLAAAANALMLSVALLGGSMASPPPRAMAENVRLADVENPELRAGEMLLFMVMCANKGGAWGRYRGFPMERLGHGEELW